MLSAEDRIELAILDLQNPDFHPPFSQEQEMYFVIQSHVESGRRKDAEIEMLTERIRILQRLLFEHGVQVIPLERWRE